MCPLSSIWREKSMAKRERERIIDVSGGGSDIDERGKFRNKDADDGSGRSASKLKKKKKLKTEQREAVVIEDNTYKVGQEKKKKKRKTSEASPFKEEKPKKSKIGKTIEGSAIRIPDSKLPAIVGDKKTSKKRAQMVEAIEEYVTLPPPVDEYDQEYRRMFENSVSLATRLEEQMEDRIYNRDVYALNTIYSQIREIIADLRATRDISAQLDELETVVLGPYHRTVGQALSEILFHVEGSITKHVKDRDIQAEVVKKLKDTIYETAMSLQEEYRSTVERARKVLL